MFEAVTLFIHASSNSVTMSYSRFLSGNSSWIDLDSQPQLEWYIPVQGRVRLVRENDTVRLDQTKYIQYLSVCP